MEIIFLRLKREFKLTFINKPSLFESLKFHCIIMSKKESYSSQTDSNYHTIWTVSGNFSLFVNKKKIFFPPYLIPSLGNMVVKRMTL